MITNGFLETYKTLSDLVRKFNKQNFFVREYSFYIKDQQSLKIEFFYIIKANNKTF